MTSAQEHQRTALQRAAFWLGTLALISSGLWVLLQYVSPSPPRTLTLSTGAPDGAYHQFGLRYQAIFQANGVTLKLLPSSGSVENLKRLNDGTAEVGFVQGGLGLLALESMDATKSQEAAVDSNLRALATVAFEPVWIFSKTHDLSDGLTALAGKRVAVGVAGSGNHKVAIDLLTTYGIINAAGQPTRNTQLVAQGGMAAAQMLQAGQVDALIAVAAPQASFITYLLEDDSLRLASLRHAEGLSRRFPYFQAVTLKRGAVNPAQNQPARDVAMIATTANLVIPQDLHPALAYLLLDAARQTHARPTLFSRAGDFPSPAGVDFLLADESDRYFKNGRPWLQRYLPFWLANFVQRLVLFIVPLAALMFPLMRFMPFLLGWKHQRKLFQRYGELKFLEADIAAHPLTPDKAANALARLDAMEQEVVSHRFALDFSDRVYTLRQHIDFVRHHLTKQQGGGK
jgi:TRAP transporter TAXI family solute receptor